MGVGGRSEVSRVFGKSFERERERERGEKLCSMYEKGIKILLSTFTKKIYK